MAPEPAQQDDGGDGQDEAPPTPVQGAPLDQRDDDPGKTCEERGGADRAGVRPLLGIADYASNLRRIGYTDEDLTDPSTTS